MVCHRLHHTLLRLKDIHLWRVGRQEVAEDVGPRQHPAAALHEVDHVEDELEVRWVQAAHRVTCAVLAHSLHEYSNVVLSALHEVRHGLHPLLMLNKPFVVERVASHLLGLTQPLPLALLNTFHIRSLARHVNITLVIAAGLAAVCLPVTHTHPAELMLARAREVVAPAQRGPALELARRFALTRADVDPDRRLALRAGLRVRLQILVGFACGMF
mmetsp:Transcript_6142/g.10521  ORF Transcript_6142/g.10521 Transcript_6142/m.10521 type:complete len:215 (-) Transcript_6142:49-693(-)